jgi:hypothetical protein
MEFRIADTFVDSLARLTGEEQKVAKNAAFDLQMNPAHPSLKFHKLEKAYDKNLWSIRVNDGIRIIVHKTAGSFMLCYVDHHNPAYAWAERRRLLTHPKTGAAQFVEVQERIEEVVIPVYVHEERPAPPKRKPLSGRTSNELLNYGVPEEWTERLLAADDDQLLALSEHLPAEAAEAVLELATGGTPVVPTPVVVADPFDHPDAQRRFRVVSNVEELQTALDFPWEKWIVYLHPDQRQFVERTFNGPARVTGSAGTGKTVVALHRAAFLVRSNPEARVLLTTFSDTLAAALRTKLQRLISSEPRLGERIDVEALDTAAQRIYTSQGGTAAVAAEAEIRALLEAATKAVEDHKFSNSFIWAEWSQIVDAWQLTTWEAYRDVPRLGRKSRLAEPQRATLWKIFSAVLAQLTSAKKTTQAGIYSSLIANLAADGTCPYQHIVVDEAQDISVMALRYLAAAAGATPNGLFFAGDSGQRIFQLPFSWKAQGVEVRGRSKNLRVNYRTSHQIRGHADRLLDSEVTDVDGNVETRRGTVSVFNGPDPLILIAVDQAQESSFVELWIKDRLNAGYALHELGVFVRSDAQISRATETLERADFAYRVLDQKVTTVSSHVSVATMHLAKGLEFRGVVVMACDDEIVPLQERLQEVGDDADLKFTYETERHLLYVACTRARDELLVTAVAPESEFLVDIQRKP